MLNHLPSAPDDAAARIEKKGTFRTNGWKVTVVRSITQTVVVVVDTPEIGNADARQMAVDIANSDTSLQWQDHVVSDIWTEDATANVERLSHDDAGGEVWTQDHQWTGSY